MIKFVSFFDVDKTERNFVMCDKRKQLIEEKEREEKSFSFFFCVKILNLIIFDTTIMYQMTIL